MITTDETGLHSIDCECSTCEVGLRPTEGERWAARRALGLRKQAEAKRAADALKKVVAEAITPRAKVAAPEAVRIPTAEQFDELRRERERLFGKGGCS
jgi:ubiquinone biosynthesis protein UbiJ